MRERLAAFRAHRQKRSVVLKPVLRQLTITDANSITSRAYLKKLFVILLWLAHVLGAADQTMARSVRVTPPTGPKGSGGDSFESSDHSAAQQAATGVALPTAVAVLHRSLQMLQQQQQQQQHPQQQQFLVSHPQDLTPSPNPQSTIKPSAVSTHQQSSSHWCWYNFSRSLLANDSQAAPRPSRLPSLVNSSPSASPSDRITSPASFPSATMSPSPSPPPPPPSPPTSVPTNPIPLPPPPQPLQVPSSSPPASAFTPSPTQPPSNPTQLPPVASVPTLPPPVTPGPTQPELDTQDPDQSQIVTPSPMQAPSTAAEPNQAPSVAQAPAQPPAESTQTPYTTPSPMQEPFLTPSPATTPGSPSVTPSPTSQSPAPPSPSTPQQSSSPSPRVSPDSNAVMPENVTQQERTTVVTGQVNADTVMVNMILQGTSVTDFRSTFKDLIMSITADVSGTPADRWNMTTSKQMGPELLYKSGRNLLDIVAHTTQSNPHESQRQLLQTGQELAVSLSLYTSNPQLLWYRLMRPIPSPAAGTNSRSASPAAACTTEYCARLISAGVPIDPNSITVSPDYNNLVADSDDQTAARDTDVQHNRRLAGIIVGSVSGAVLLLVLFLQRKRIASCFSSGSKLKGPMNSDSSQGMKQQLQQAVRRAKTPYYERHQKLDDYLFYDFDVCQAVPDSLQAATGDHAGSQHQPDNEPTGWTYWTSRADVLPASDEHNVTGQYKSGATPPQVFVAAKPATRGRATPAVVPVDSVQKQIAKYKAAAAAAAERPVTGSPTSPNTPRTPRSPSASPSARGFTFSGFPTNRSAAMSTRTYTDIQATTPWLSNSNQTTCGSAAGQQGPQLNEEHSEPQLDATCSISDLEIPPPAGARFGEFVTGFTQQAGALKGQQLEQQVACPKHVRFLEPLEQQALANHFARSKQQMRSL